MPPKVHNIQLTADQLESLAEKCSASMWAKFESKVAEIVDNKVNLLQSTVQDKTDDLEQRSRQNNLRIFGMKESKDENTDTLVLQVAEKIGVVLPVNSICRSHRVGAKSSERDRPIIVRFLSYADRRKVFKAKKLLKNSGISIREDLTKIRQNILVRASESYPDDPVWSNDGVIFIKLGRTYHRVLTEAELDNLITTHPPATK